MAIGMCLWVVEHSFKNLERLENQNKAMLKAWIGSSSLANDNEKERGSGFVSQQNRNKTSLPKPKFNPSVSKNMQDPTGKYLWLFSGLK